MMMSAVHSDEFYMARAFELARRGRFTTTPNPNVGCVLVRDDRIVGEGFHLRAGEPHAEVLALRMAGEQARGATAYVTLEPCSHHGRTPPAQMRWWPPVSAGWSQQCKTRIPTWPDGGYTVCSRRGSRCNMD